MKKICLFLLLLCVSLGTVQAQSSKSKKKSKAKDKKETKSKKNTKKDKDEDEYSFKDKLWYGGSFVLGYNQQGNAGILAIGVSPMVGYKVLPWLSIGPRIAPTFVAYKAINNSGGISRGRTVDFEYGVFTRIKAFGSIYVQGEAGRRSFGEPFFGNSNPNKIQFNRTQRVDYLLGGGFAQGAGGIGSDITILYNLAAANSSDINRFNESPLVIRFGLTYKF
jgi:hypothetical protein